MTNFKVEKTDEGTLVTQGNMTKTTAENIKKDLLNQSNQINQAVTSYSQYLQTLNY